MEGPPLGPGGEDITWPDQVAPRGRKASSTRKNKPQTSNLIGPEYEPRGIGHFGLIFDQNLPFFKSGVLVRLELRGAIVESAPKSRMA